MGLVGPTGSCRASPTAAARAARGRWSCAAASCAGSARPGPRDRLRQRAERPLVYPAAVTSVDAVEPSDAGLGAVGRAPRSGRTVPVERVGLDGQRLEAADATYDAALSTFTLCTIPDAAAGAGGGTPGAAARRRACTSSSTAWLRRPGGRARGSTASTPLQRRVAGGCHLTRDAAGAGRGGRPRGRRGGAASDLPGRRRVPWTAGVRSAARCAPDRRRRQPRSATVAALRPDACGDVDGRRCPAHDTSSAGRSSVTPSGDRVIGMPAPQRDDAQRELTLAGRRARRRPAPGAGAAPPTAARPRTARWIRSANASTRAASYVGAELATGREQTPRSRVARARRPARASGSRGTDRCWRPCRSSGPARCPACR